MTDSKRNRPHCSRCGSLESLRLVTLLYGETSEAGRVLVYCPQCRNVFKDTIGVSIPLKSVTTEIFLDLYRNGKTASDPLTAVGIVFGNPDPDIIRKAQFILNQSRASDSG